MSLRELFRGRFDVDAANRAMRPRMAEVGLDYDPPDRAWDTRLAQELATWASERGVPLHDRLFRAVFVEQRNVGAPDVLVAVAAEAGLDPEAARVVVRDRSHRAAVDADWAYARGRGVTAVPTYVMGKFGVSGAQPYEVLQALVMRAGGEPRAALPDDD